MWPSASAPAHLAPDLPTKIPSLDGLRAAAIALAIVDHALETWGAPTFLAPLTRARNFGVRVFFAISGLITTLLLRELDARREVSLKNFYARRFFRSRARCASQDHVVEVT